MPKLLRLGAVLALAAAAAIGAPHADAKTVVPHQTIAVIGASQSSNWGGYNQGLLEPGKAGGFSQVSASWVVPTATQHTRGEAEYSATWIGIGGGCLETTCTATDTTLIQAGSEQDVAADGTPAYSLWWEIIPGPSIAIDLPVTAGNTVSVDIREGLPGVWTITVNVASASGTRTFTQTVPYTSTHATVEWIEETPLIIGTDGTGISAMPNLTKTAITNAKVNGGNPNLVLAEEVDLVSSNNTILVKPSAPSGGNSFSVCSYATSCT